jgi:hypothetical protein
LLERPSGCCPSNHILSAKSVRATGYSAASTDPPPSTISNGSSITKNCAKSTIESALKALAMTGAFAARLRDLCRLSTGAMGGQFFYQSGSNDRLFEAFAMCNAFKKM